MARLLIPEALDRPCRSAEVDGWDPVRLDLPNTFGIPVEMLTLYVLGMMRAETPRQRAHWHARFTTGSQWAVWLREHEPSCWREEKERS